MEDELGGPQSVQGRDNKCLKTNVRVSLYVIKHHAIKTCGVWRYSSTIPDLDIR
jgi:hypothetical protein